MTSFVVLDAGRPTTVDAVIHGETVQLGAEAIEAALGWELKPQGLCRADVCIPVAGSGDGALTAASLADALRRPVAVDVQEAAAYFGPAFVPDAPTLEAPDFTLPDLDGRQMSLSEHRGSKVLLAAWASW